MVGRPINDYETLIKYANLYRAFLYRYILFSFLLLLIRQIEYRENPLYHFKYR